MNPFLSICIPTYNRYELLVRLCKELIQLPSSFYEIVICDDNSKDFRIANFLNEYEKLDSRISVYFNKINLGISGNYRRILSLAKGKYVMLLSNEDQLLEGFDEFWVNFQNSNCDYDLILSKVEYNGQTKNLYLDGPICSTNDFKQITELHAQNIFGAHISGNIFKKELIDFDLHKKITNQYFPIIPLNIMCAAKENIYLTDEPLIKAGFFEPLYKKGFKFYDKWQELWNLSLVRQLVVYKKYIKDLVQPKHHNLYYKILAKSFQYYIFNKREIGISKIFPIAVLCLDPSLRLFFTNGLNKLLKKFLDSCLNKYFNLKRNRE
jgi:glycosyltransferase involved in cell wall biosynthesis